MSQSPAPPEVDTSAPSTLGVGVIVWLSSELMFFAGLFAAYFTLRSVNEVWPPADVHLTTARTGLATLVLVASSGTMHLAVSAASRGEDTAERRRALNWLGVTALLGLLFLSNQILEYTDPALRIDQEAYGSAFFLLTGFHGLHVFGGLLFMAGVALAIAGASRAPAHPSVEVCAYYWHFVDVVWVAMFTIIYVVQ